MGSYRMWIFILLWIVILCFTDIHALGTGCRFYGKKASCYKANLTYIPYIPGNIQYLDFERNRLQSVSQDTFANIEDPDNLLALFLSGNQITHVTKDAFVVFKHLSELGLSHNNINIVDMKNLLVDLSQRNSLHALYLVGMGKRTINDETFSRLDKTPALNVSLEYNDIEEVSIDTLKRLDGIHRLVLDNNKISYFELPAMKSLIELRISSNRLVDIPNFCISTQETESLTRNLRTLYLNDNRIMTISNETCRCLPRLDRFQVNRNEISEFPSKLLSYCSHITQFSASDNSGHNMKVNPFAFSSNTLRMLQLGFNGDAMKIFQSLPSVFQELPSLRYLKLSYINMFHLSDRNVTDLFFPLSNLTHIECYSCQLHGDINAVLGNKPNIERINLRRNEYQNIPAGTLTALPNIKVLLLGVNKISHISQNALPIPLLNKLSLFDLSKNPLSCDCDIEWFIHWIKAANKTRLSFYPHGYTCASPAKWINKGIKDVKFSYLECHPFSMVDWIGLVGGSIFVVVIIVGIILYKKRWKLKHYIYMMRRRRDYEQLNGHDYLYDAFVAYSNSEREWVIDVLIPLLEDEHNLKLCVHERDFQPGAFINDNIVERMHESKRIILVLSNAFVTSDWCVFEMKVAHSMHIEEDKLVVVVMFEELLGRNINNSLKCLLESTTYLEWTEDEVGHGLFIAKLKDSMNL